MKASLLMREAGRLKATPLQRFGRVQRRAGKLAPKAGQPRGVLRFKTREEVTTWQNNRPVS